MTASPALLTKEQLATITRRVQSSHERGDDAGPIAVDRRLLLQHIAALEQRVEAGDKLAASLHEALFQMPTGAGHAKAGHALATYRALPKEPQ